MSTVALSSASSTSVGVVISIIVMTYLAEMDGSLPKIALACCACSTCSGAIRTIQYLLHGVAGIKTYYQIQE
jgi:hypothetical protein